MFELYVEQGRILEKMDLAGSISALLHLVFVFNLKYPKVKDIIPLFRILLLKVGHVVLHHPLHIIQACFI